MFIGTQSIICLLYLVTISNTSFSLDLSRMASSDTPKRKTKKVKDTDEKKTKKDKEPSKEEDEVEEEEVKKTKKKLPVLEKIDEETQQALARRLEETNRLILHFRNIGYATAHDGTLYVPKPLEQIDTGVEGKIKIVGNTFYLDVGKSREHNEYIKNLGGHWKGYVHAWQFYGLKSLETVKASFIITEVTEGETKKKEVKPPSETELQRKVELCIMGDYIAIRGYTKAIKNEIKTLTAYRWDPDSVQWIVPKKNKKELEELMDTLKEENKIGSYDYVDE
jgi:hypothetical protein